MMKLILNLSIVILLATLVVGNDFFMKCETVKSPADAKATENSAKSTIDINDGSSGKGQEDNLHCVKTCVNGKCTKTGNKFECICFAGFTGSTCNKETVFSNCKDVSKAGFTKSKVYPISLTGRLVPIQAYCDLTTAGEEWLVIQRRMDGSEDFNKNWNDYRFGFGNLYDEFWLGLDYMNMLTTTRSYQLRVDLEDFDGNKAYALYKKFTVGNAKSKYVLKVGGYSGTAGDALKFHNNMKFSTKDSDNDNYPRGRCAIEWQAAGWFNKCLHTNLNGHFMPKGTVSAKSICWLQWKKKFASLKKIEMKIKPN